MKQATDQFDLGENITSIHSVDLPFSDHVHRFIVCQSALSGVKGEETQAGRLCREKGKWLDRVSGVTRKQPKRKCLSKPQHYSKDAIFRLRSSCCVCAGTYAIA